MKKFYVFLLLATTTFATAQQWQWVTGIEQAYEEYFDLISADGQGNVYTYATFSEDISNGAFQMNTTGTGADIYFVKFNSAGEMQWYRHLPGNGVENFWALDADNAGNVYITGRFSNGISFGTQSFSGNGSFVAKYDTNGTLLWAKKYTNSEQKRIRVTPSGHIYITGSFTSSLTYDTTTLTPVVNTWTGYILKLDSSGILIWARMAEYNNTNSTSGVTDLNIDGNDNVYLSGRFGSGIINFGEVSLNSATNSNTYFVKYNSAGTALWAKRLGNTGCSNSIMSVLPDAEGNIYVSGDYCGTINVGNINLTSASGSRMFVSKYSSDGNALWAKTSTGGTLSLLTSGDLDSHGNLIVSGNFGGPINLGNNVSASTTDMAKYIAKYSPDGIPQWITTTSAIDVNNEMSVECFGDNVIYSAGVMVNQPTLSFDNITYTKTGSNLYNIHIGKLLDTPLSVAEFDTNNFRVYPNPATNSITLDSQENIDNILITDINGRTVATSTGKSTINIENLGNGIYFITATTASGKVTKKIMKQ